jgi:hypothetical protein
MRREEEVNEGIDRSSPRRALEPRCRDRNAIGHRSIFAIVAGALKAIANHYLRIRTD